MHSGTAITPPALARATPGSRSLRPVLLLALGVLAARVVYLAIFCRYDLVEDEAQYWLWSKYPDWSYYSKGPGVAWVIWLATRALGDAEWVVRLPTAVFTAIGTVAAGGLVRDMAAWALDRAPDQSKAWATPARAGLLAALAYAVAPALQMTGLLMTIDGPYVACWAAACWCFWRAVMLGGTRAWVGCGLFISAGFLFKYTMLLVIPGLLGWLWMHRRHTRMRWPAAGLGAAGACASLGLLPVLIWNAQRDWPTVRHLLGHLGVRGGDIPDQAPRQPWSPMFVVEFVGMQLGMIGPMLVLALVTGVVLWRQSRRARRADSGGDPRWIGQSLLLAAGLPILAFYVLVSMLHEAEGNWALGAYATLLPLAGWLGADAVRGLRGEGGDGSALSGDDRAALRVRRIFWRVGLWYALVAALPIHLLTQIGDLALALGRSETFRARFTSVMNREPRDPVGRLRGAREEALHVMEVLQTLPPGRRFVIADHYGKACQLTYALRNQQFGPAEINAPMPPVLCAMSSTGGRKSQFDYWAWNALDQHALQGADAVIVGTIEPWAIDRFRRMFASIDESSVQRLRGEHRPSRGLAGGRAFVYPFPVVHPPKSAEESQP